MVMDTLLAQQEILITQPSDLKKLLQKQLLMDFVAGHSNAHGFGMSSENKITALKEALADLNVQEQNIVIDGLLNTVDDVEKVPYGKCLKVNGWFDVIKTQ